MPAIQWLWDKRELSRGHVWQLEDYRTARSQTNFQDFNQSGFCIMSCKRLQYYFVLNNYTGIHNVMYYVWLNRYILQGYNDNNNSHTVTK